MASLGITGKAILKESFESESDVSKVTVPPGGTKAKALLWQQRMDTYEAKQHVNVFSSHYDGSVPAVDSSTYGKPVEGSLTELRGKIASHWVDAEVDHLKEEIRKIGRQDPTTGQISCTFEEIFLHYVDISNSVVGILLRARKRGHVQFEGEMLFQNKSEKVVITIV